MSAQSKQKLFIHFPFFSSSVTAAIVLPLFKVMWHRQAECEVVNQNKILHQKQCVIFQVLCNIVTKRVTGLKVFLAVLSFMPSGKFKVGVMSYN